MGVVLLLALIWAAVLLPPALRCRAERQQAFLVSFGGEQAPGLSRPPPRKSQRIRCRRRIAGGLLIAMVATLLVGLLPTFRPLLVVHLFLVDSFLAYVGLLAHMANRAAARARSHAGTVPGPAEVPVRVDVGRLRRRRTEAGPAVLPELVPVAPAG